VEGMSLSCYTLIILHLCLHQVYDDLIDHAGHQYGPDSNELRMALVHRDGQIQELLMSLQRSGLNNKVSVVYLYVSVSANHLNSCDFLCFCCYILLQLFLGKCLTILKHHTFSLLISIKVNVIIVSDHGMTSLSKDVVTFVQLSDFVAEDLVHKVIDYGAVSSIIAAPGKYGDVRTTC
jgi:predicted AlkP superfamily pyrophosphatase or phosphodiesterase